MPMLLSFFLLGGNLPVQRLGFGAMHLTGSGVWDNPQNLKEARAVLKRTLGINFIDPADA